jgi:hypothetical protein
MFKNWTNIFTTDCLVIKMPNGEYVYPIFKNGRSSLRRFAKQDQLEVIKNEQLSTLTDITVFLREPVERFVSGVHTVIEFEDIVDVPAFLKEVENFNFYNRHFIPQVYWLLHLLKYFKGKVKLLPVKALYNLIPNRDAPNINKLTAERQQQILSIEHKNYIQADQRLMYSYLGKTVELKTIIEEFKYALSSS